MWLALQVGYSLHFQQYGSRMGERQRWASVAAQHNGLLQSRHPTYVGTCRASNRCIRLWSQLVLLQRNDGASPCPT